jgi:hypothetical protein
MQVPFTRAELQVGANLVALRTGIGQSGGGGILQTTHVREQVKQTHACGPRAGLTFVLRLPN